MQGQGAASCDTVRLLDADNFPRFTDARHREEALRSDFAVGLDVAEDGVFSGLLQTLQELKLVAGIQPQQADDSALEAFATANPWLLASTKGSCTPVPRP